MELNIMKNMESAGYHDSTYGQDVEPHGTYVLQKDSDIELFPGWVGGKANLNKPLYIDLDKYDNIIDYKRDLSNKFKAKGKALTKKLMSKGYDAIITKDKKYGFGEIVLFPNAKFVLFQPQTESVKDKTIKCTKCDWDWKESETEEHDKYVCHKCGNDMTRRFTEIRTTIKKIIRETLLENNNKVWYHGTPDVRELEKEGGFNDRYITIEYVENIDEWNDLQNRMKVARESGNEDEYFKILDLVPKLRKNKKIRKPIFLTDISSVAKTYADPSRAFDYQDAQEKVLKVNVKNGRGVTINAVGDRFRFINTNKVIDGFVRGGFNEEEVKRVIESLNFALGTAKGIKTDNIAAIGEHFGVDYIDVLGVLDSYMGGTTKSTVRMVFNPNDIIILK